MHQRQARAEWDPFYQLDERFYEWDNWEDAANAYAGRVVAGGGG